MSGESTRIVLVRHGEPQWPLDGILGGHAGCSGLSELGRRQAEALRDRLARTGELAGATALYASILPRAIETADIIAPALGDLKVATHCDLCEIHLGDADGVPMAELRDRFGTWGPSHEVIHQRYAPGAETWGEFLARSSRMLTELADRHAGETVVIACHGGIVRASFVAFGNQPAWQPFDLDTELTSLTEWRHRAEFSRPWALIRYNDAAHVYGVE